MFFKSLILMFVEEIILITLYSSLILNSPQLLRENLPVPI